MGVQTSTSSLTAAQNASAVASVGQGFQLWFRVPIVGWSSTVQMSNDTDTRIVDFTGTQSSQAVTGNVTNISFTSTKDSHGAWNGTQYVVPVSGDYVIGGSLVTNTSAITGVPYINGVAHAGLFATSGATGTVTAGAILISSLKAGDLISLRSNTSATVSTGTISIWRLSGPSVIAATESVNARYYSATATITGTASTITYSTKDFDSHNAYSAGTYTIPVSGKYQINAALSVNGTYAINAGTVISIFKNGVIVSEYTYEVSGAQSGAQALISDILSAVAGDAVTIRIRSNATGPTVNASTSANYFSISRTGN